MNFRPLGSKVLIKRQDGEKVSKGGIIIPDAHQAKSTRCNVIAVGPGKFKRFSSERISPPVAVGDTVLIGGWEGHEVKLDGVAHLVIESDGILAVEDATA